MSVIAMETVLNVLFSVDFMVQIVSVTFLL